MAVAAAPLLDVLAVSAVGAELFAAPADVASEARTAARSGRSSLDERDLFAATAPPPPPPAVAAVDDDDVLPDRPLVTALALFGPLTLDMLCRPDIIAADADAAPAGCATTRPPAAPAVVVGDAMMRPGTFAGRFFQKANEL